MRAISRLIRVTVILVATAGLTGCVVSAGPAPATASVGVGTDYYTPLYYNGYVVYYDDVGRPLYYVGGNTYYVPNTYVYYGNLTTHYRTHRANYHRWYGARGARYRTYRRSNYQRPVHRGPAGTRRGPATTRQGQRRR